MPIEQTSATRRILVEQFISGSLHTHLDVTEMLTRPEGLRADGCCNIAISLFDLNLAKKKRKVVTSDIVNNPVLPSTL